MRERSGQFSAALRSLGPWAGLEPQEVQQSALYLLGRAEVGPSSRPDCLPLCPAQGAEASRAGASAWVTADLPQRTSPSAGTSGERRAPRERSSVRVPQGWPRGTWAPGHRHGLGAFKDLVSGEALWLRLRTRSTYFSALRVAGNSSHRFGLQGLGEGVPQG